MSPPPLPPKHDACTCVPCERPGGGIHPGQHCAACCYGSLIEEYDLACPVGEHRRWARAQYGIEPLSVVSQGTPEHQETER